MRLSDVNPINKFVSYVVMLYIRYRNKQQQTEPTMFKVYAIKNNEVIHSTEAEQDLVNTAKDVFKALTDCDTITVMRSNGILVSQENV